MGLSLSCASRCKAPITRLRSCWSCNWLECILSTQTTDRRLSIMVMSAGRVFRIISKRSAFSAHLHEGFKSTKDVAGVQSVGRSGCSPFFNRQPLLLCWKRSLQFVVCRASGECEQQTTLPLLPLGLLI